MDSRAAAKYSPRIGNLVINFIDFYTSHEQLLQEGEESWDIDEALEYFAMEKHLSPGDVYQVSLYLKDQEYPIDPLTFHPDYIPEDEKEVAVDQSQTHSVFDEYNKALQRQQYEKAHQIFKSMTPTQQQVIKDRRGCMNKKNTKTAQKSDTEAVLEKEVPVEPGVGLLKELPKQPKQDLSELIEPAEGLVAQHATLGLPSQSMTLFIPFAHSLDEFKRVHNQEVDRETLHKRTEDFLRDFGKVLHYLDEQGYDVDELQALVKKYAGLFYQEPTKAAAAQKILALAGRLQEDGKSDVAGRLLKTIAVDESWFRDWVGPRNKTYLDEAEKIASEGPLSKFKMALDNEKFDEAREIYLSLSPVQRQLADEMSKKHFAINSIISLYKVGESLFNKGNMKEADEVSNVVKAQFVELPSDWQKEIILLIVPENELPQGFQGGLGNKPQLEEKLMDMQNRLIPAETHCSAKLITQLLKLADSLDQKGYANIADQIGEVFQDLVKQAQMPYVAPGEIEKVLHRLEPPKSGREVGIARCQECGKEMYYDKKKERPMYCPSCQKGPWGVGKVSGKTLIRPFVKADKAKEKYVSEEGHFKGKEGSGERWDNCIKYQMSKGHSKESAEKICGYIKSRKGSLETQAAEKKDDHGGKPAKVVEIADAIRRDNPGTSDEAAYRMAWRNYCENINPGYEGCEGGYPQAPKAKN